METSQTAYMEFSPRKEYTKGHQRGQYVTVSVSVGNKRPPTLHTHTHAHAYIIYKEFHMRSVNTSNANCVADNFVAIIFRVHFPFSFSIFILLFCHNLLASFLCVGRLMI